MTTLHRWRKSSHSNQETACVEVSHTLDEVRDSKDPAGPTLRFNVASFAEFVQTVKTGRFDR